MDILRIESNSLQCENESQQKSKSSLLQDIEVYKAKEVSLKRDIGHLKNDNESLKRKRENDFDKVKKYKKEIDHLSNELDSSNRKFVNEIEYERNQYSSLRQAYDSHQDKISIFRSNEESYSRQVDQLKQQIVDLEKSNQKHMFATQMVDVEKRFYERNITDLKDQLSHEKMKLSCTIMWIYVPSL